MFKSRYMPCPECGASVDRITGPWHECSLQRWEEYQIFGLREEIAELEPGIRYFLETSSGQFATWLAARQVRAQG